MKKFFTFIAAALFSVSLFADPNIPAPIVTDAVSFTDSVIVTMSKPSDYQSSSYDIYYSIDGTTDPNCDCSAAPEYRNEIVLKQTTTIKARAFDGNNWSPLVEVTFTKNEVITVAEAVQIGLALDSAAVSETEYTVEGYVISTMDFSMTYMNQSFYMADEATATESQFEGYNCYPIDGADTVKVLVGDKVSLTGKIKHYKNKKGESTIEIEKANVVFISKAEGDRSIDKTVEQITVAQALAIGAALDADKVSAKTYDIVGYITQIDDNSFNTNYNNMTFWIADAQGTAATNADGAFEVYRGRPEEELKVGWKVVVRDQIKNYKGNTIETATSNCPVTILEKAEEEKIDYPEGVISCDSAEVLAKALADPTADNKTVEGQQVKVWGYVTYAYAATEKEGVVKQSAWLADSKSAKNGNVQGAYLQIASMDAAVEKGDLVEIEGTLAKYYKAADNIIVEVINGTMKKVGEQGIENVVLTEKAQKVMVDGVIYIIRDNKMYNVQGTQVR